MDPSALELDAVAADVQDRAQLRLGQLVRLLADHDALLADTDGAPSPVPAWLSWWRGSTPTRATRRLEQSLEQAQRRVLSIGHQRDRVRAEIALLREEIALLERFRPLNTDTAAAGARLARVRELLHVQQDFLELHERLADALVRLEAAGEAELRALDRSIGSLAAEAVARDLASALGPGELDASVRRVHLAAREGRAVLVHGIDTLGAELSLLGTRDRRWDAAESEVVRTLVPPGPRGR